MAAPIYAPTSLPAGRGFLARAHQISRSTCPRRWCFMTALFPGGVADPSKRLAFVRLAGDEIVAVDLRSGNVIWRRTGLGRPIGVVAQGLVTIHRNNHDVG